MALANGYGAYSFLTGEVPMLPIRTILHPTDFSECSRHAGDFAASLAKDYRARLILLHVVEPLLRSPEVSMPLDPLALRTSAERELRQLQEAHKDIHSECVTAFGNPAHEIVRLAREIKPELIVLGTHGRTGLGRLVMGSVAEEVMRGAPSPVLVSKPTDPQPSEEYDDWISAAMSRSEPRGERTTEIGDELKSRTAGAGCGATVDHTLRTTHCWLRDVRLRLGEEDPPHAFRLLRAVLHVLRDHLSVDHVASLAAQLPLLLRGVFYEGWDPSGKPDRRRHSADFIEQVKTQIAPEPLDHPEWAIRAVLDALRKHFTPGEVAKLRRALPREIRELWEGRLTESAVSK